MGNVMYNFDSLLEHYLKRNNWHMGHMDIDAMLNLLKPIELEYQCKWGNNDKCMDTNISTEDTHLLSFDDVWE